MAFRRAALLVGAVSVLGMTLFTVPAASAAPGAGKVPVTVRAVQVGTTGADGVGAGNGIQACGVDITSRNGHDGQRLCNTAPVFVTWEAGLWVLGKDDVVVGTNYFIYHDPLTHWDVLQGGEASHTLPSATLGLYLINAADPVIIGVYGTDNQLWCNNTTGLLTWSGWHRC